MILILVLIGALIATAWHAGFLAAVLGLAFAVLGVCIGRFAL